MDKAWPSPSLNSSPSQRSKDLSPNKRMACRTSEQRMSMNYRGLSKSMMERPLLTNPPPGGHRHAKQVAVGGGESTGRVTDVEH